jgi:hypothetical protein
MCQVWTSKLERFLLPPRLRQIGLPLLLTPMIVPSDKQNFQSKLYMWLLRGRASPFRDLNFFYNGEAALIHHHDEDILDRVISFLTSGNRA